MKFDLEKLFETIDGYRDEVIELQKMLTAIPALAPESNGDGEDNKALALRKYLINYGFPKPDEYNAPDTRVSVGYRPNILYNFEGEDNSKTVFVMSHLDVVPEGVLTPQRTPSIVARGRNRKCRTIRGRRATRRA